MVVLVFSLNGLRILAAGSIATAALFAAPALVHAARPNIVVIQTDDQNGRTVKANYRGPSGQTHQVMPNTMREIFRGGTEFSNFYAAAPICSPSRAALLTGRYPHNNGLIRNSGSHGGWEGWQNQSTASKNLPLTLSAAGYRTLHVGKFMNGYYDSLNNRVDTTEPAGWDRWFTTAYMPGTRFYGYKVTDNGVARGPFGNPNYRANGPGLDSSRCTAARLLKPKPGLKCNYLPDRMTQEAVKEIKRNPKSSPFYLQVDYQAPHGDIRPPKGPQPATRHDGSASRTSLPRPGDFNEADFSDKPAVVRSHARKPLGPNQISRLTDTYRRYIESLRSVDDGVGAIIRTLRRTGQLDNTYIFYLSDHGYYLGEHRFDVGKFMPYDASSKVAMAVRGPGVKRGGVSREVTGNVDIAATAVRLAKATPDYELDGRPLKPFWKDSALRSRRPVEISLQLLPSQRSTTPYTEARVSGGAPVLNYDGFRVGPYKYVDYEAGGQELYDLSRDPFELRNKIDKPAYAAVRRYMQRHLPEVTSCSAADCRTELPPWPTPGS